MCKENNILFSQIHMQKCMHYKEFLYINIEIGILIFICLFFHFFCIKQMSIYFVFAKVSSIFFIENKRLNPQLEFFLFFFAENIYIYLINKLLIIPFF